MDVFQEEDALALDLLRKVATHIEFQYAGKFVCDYLSDSARAPYLPRNILNVLTRDESKKVMCVQAIPLSKYPENVEDGSKPVSAGIAFYATGGWRHPERWGHVLFTVEERQGDFSVEQRKQIARLIKKSLEPKLLGIIKMKPRTFDFAR